MKHLIFALVLATSFWAATPDAKAADWTNGVVSCDINVKELSSWFVFWNWGKWQKFDVHFYLNKTPSNALAFSCRAISLDNTGFGCTRPLKQIDTERLFNMVLFIEPIIPPGTSKNAACEIAYKAATQ